MDLVIDSFGFIKQCINQDNDQDCYIPKAIQQQFTDAIKTTDNKPVMEDDFVNINLINDNKVVIHRAEPPIDNKDVIHQAEPPIDNKVLAINQFDPIKADLAEFTVDSKKFRLLDNYKPKNRPVPTKPNNFIEQRMVLRNYITKVWYQKHIHVKVTFDNRMRLDPFSMLVADDVLLAEMLIIIRRYAKVNKYQALFIMSRSFVLSPYSNAVELKARFSKNSKNKVKLFCLYENTFG